MSDDNIPHKKRTTCHTCHFPPRTCICPSLPSTPLHPLFRKCKIIVLQHPHEKRRKNRSLPLVDLCVFGNVKDDAQGDVPSAAEFVIMTIVGRGLGPDRNANVIQLLSDPNQVVVLVFPGPNAMDLEEGIRLAERRCGFNDEANSDANTTSKCIKMILLFIDATWKHAREMEAKLTKTMDCSHWIRVQLVPTASEKSKSETGESTPSIDISGTQQHEQAAINVDNNPATQFVQRRFEIRAPPSPNHLSTAECLAWVASRVEQNPVIYESITNVLDYMVHLWRVNVVSGKKRKEVMTQKGLGI